jgi:hypothetical protein
LSFFTLTYPLAAGTTADVANFAFVAHEVLENKNVAAIRITKRTLVRMIGFMLF